MKYLSVCSGIEAASVAWHHLGWEPVGFAEIEKFPSQVLAHRFPGVPNLGDMTKFREWDIEPGTVDILVGGTPCQAFSVAGLRKGLADPRGNLALTFVAMVDHYRPEWVVWENVPGVLSSSGGRDFGAFLGALGQLGYGFAYRVLDAQYFGVAQRRRRVFVVAHASGDPRRAAEVLFEPESLRGDSPPSREAGQKTTADPGASASGGNLWDTVGALCADTHPGAYSGQDAYTGRIIPSLYESHPQDSRLTGGNNTPLVTDNSLGFQSKASFCTGIEYGISVSITTESKPAVVYPDAVVQPGEALPLAYDDRSQAVSTDTHHTLRGESAVSRTSDAIVQSGEASAFSWQSGADMRGMVPRPTAQLQRCQIEAVMIQPFAQNQLGEVRAGEVFNTINTNSNASGRNTPLVQTAMHVRRLTPMECERLQGFPDGWTDIKPGGKETADSPRYKALGNSMAVPVMRWIGERIAKASRG